MKRSAILLTASLFLTFSCSHEYEEYDGTPTPAIEETNENTGEAGFISGELVVKFSDEMIQKIESDLTAGKIATRSMELNQAMDELGISSIERLFPYAGEYEGRTRREGLHKWYVVKYSQEVTATRADKEMRSIPGVEHTEKRAKMKPMKFNDPDLGSQWGFINTAHPGFDINVQNAWDRGIVGDSSVIVAVVDGGIDLSHPDLRANCYSENYNFVDHNATIVSHSHGTHVAGTIAAVNNNGYGLCGVAGGDAASGRGGVKLMSCQIFKTVGQTSTSGSSSSAIKWGADHGAVICQNSWGYDFDYDGDGVLKGNELTAALNATISLSDKAAVDYFIKYAGCDDDGNQLPGSPMKGGVVIFAAGNENIENGAPANYEPIIAVGAIDRDGTRADFSNFGDFVDIAAPGVSIFSTLPGTGNGYMSGTSMACPHVSGVAALLVSFFGGQGFTNDMLKEKLLGGANAILPLSERIGYLVDMMGSLSYDENTVPQPVDSLIGSSVSNNINLQWTATADTSNHPAYGYLLVYGANKESVENATPDALGDASSIAIQKASPVGDTIKTSLSGLKFSTDYYFKVYAHSFSGKYSEPSDLLTVTTGVNNPPVIMPSGSVKTTLRCFESVRIPFTVSDPDGHKFTVAYQSGSKADSFNNLTIRVSASLVDAGTYTAVITATDEYGASSTYEYVYTVLPNYPPEKVADPANVHLTSFGQRITIDLTKYISDPDGEVLTYTYTSSNSSVASLSFNQNTLVMDLMDMGLTEIAITGKDGKGASAQISFKVLGRDASIEYSAYPVPVVGTLNIATGDSLSDAQVDIHSQTGSKLFSGIVKASAFEPGQIDLSGLAPGTYSMSLKFDSKDFKQTIVKK